MKGRKREGGRGRSMGRGVEWMGGCFERLLLLAKGVGVFDFGGRCGVVILGKQKRPFLFLGFIGGFEQYEHKEQKGKKKKKTFWWGMKGCVRGSQREK